MTQKKKVLFITQTDLFNASNKYGGGVISKRNLDLLKSFCDVDIFFPKHKRNIFEKFYYTFLKRRLYFTDKEMAQILKLVKDNNYDTVFFDNSIHGELVKKIKKLKGKVVSFFHNIESAYYKQIVKKRFLIVKHCESLTVKYSDKLILLNDRDRQVMENNYKNINLSKVTILPITLKDDYFYDESQLYVGQDNKRMTGLFFGSCFAPNYNGIKWFVDNVMPYVDFDLIIAGRGFGEKMSDLCRDNVKVYDEVSNIKQLFENADFFVSPIFEGSGMKVKTCEALKYGKTIFGTDESFVGYDIEFEKVGGLCNSAEEFIVSINNYLNRRNKTKFNQYSRQIFCIKYTDQVALKKFKEII